MLKAFGCKGSSARVILSSDVDDAEKQNFDKLCSYLKEGNLVSVLLVVTDVR